MKLPIWIDAIGEKRKKRMTALVVALTVIKEAYGPA